MEAADAAAHLEMVDHRVQACRSLLNFPPATGAQALLDALSCFALPLWHLPLTYLARLGLKTPQQIPHAVVRCHAEYSV